MLFSSDNKDVWHHVQQVIEVISNSDPLFPGRANGLGAIVGPKTKNPLAGEVSDRLL